MKISRDQRGGRETAAKAVGLMESMRESRWRLNVWGEARRIEAWESEPLSRQTLSDTAFHILQALFSPNSFKTALLSEWQYTSAAQGEVVVCLCALGFMP